MDHTMYLGSTSVTGTEAPPKLRPAVGAPWLFWGLACVLLAWVQIAWGGYQLGVGNQAIQIPFLQTLHTPGFFHRDLMVQTTLPQYPSLFYHALAWALSLADVPALYLALHVVATAAVFLAAAALSRVLFSDAWAALALLAMMVAGHHQSLAGETLYSPGFTHTWAVFPLSLLALTLFHRERYWLAFGLVGAILNLHALEAGYLAAIFGFVGLCQVRRVGIWRLLGCVGVFLVMGLPAILMLLGARHASFDAQWLQLMHVRSADHSFPSSWWQAGTSDIPRFVCIVGLAAVAMGFRMPPLQRRMALLLAVAIGLLFAAGYVFTELRPVPVIVRAQLFRSSRFLLIVALAVIAHGCVCGWRQPWRGASRRDWRAWLEFASATLTAACLAVPALLVLLPGALAVAVLVAIVSGRLAWYQALVAGAAIVVCLAAWESLHFLLPGLSREVTWRALLEGHGPGLLGWIVLACAGGLWVLGQRRLTRGRLMLALIAGTALVGAVTIGLFPATLRQTASDAAWVDVQRWARNHTPADALFLTPAQQSGFRIHSQRAIVGEWRDGTQLYFSAAFTKPWWERMNTLQPGMVLNEDGRSLLARGKSLGQLEDAQIIEVAQRYQADYVVLPPSESRALDQVYDNKTWAIYRPAIGEPATNAAGSAERAQATFLQQVALPAIEKHRKSDAWVQIVDAGGRPIDGAAYRITQTSSPFGFGCSLPFFHTPAIDFRADYRPPVVTPPELARFAEVFNYSVTPFSGLWSSTEPQEGKPDYADLDAYVDWCARQSVRVELKFVAGYPPAWLRTKPRPEQLRLMLARAQALAARYGKRIESWQVTSEGIGLEQAAPLFTELRKIAPQARLGIDDDGRFWSPRKGPARQEDMQRGLEAVRLLKRQGVQVDFLSLHAHRPTGLWAEGQDIYDTLDAIAKEGLRVHISEFGVPVGARIEGPWPGGRWTPALQAEYYRQFFTICFSHPSVDAVNLFGIGRKTWDEGEGVLDENGQPTPAFAALKELVTLRWRTRLSGTLGLDGAVGFRGFHGGYEVVVTLPSGQTATATMDVRPEQPNRYKFRLDASTGKLLRWEGQ